MARGRAFEKEREQLALRLDEVIRGYLSDARVPSVDDRLMEVYGEFDIGTFPQTREMRFFLEDVRCFTPDLIGRLRRLVSVEFPTWTVVPQYNERVFTVGGEAVYFADSVVREAVREETPAYREWLTATLAFDERRYGPLRRQLRRVLPTVPTAMRQLATAPIVPLATFDRETADSRIPLIWVLLSSKYQTAVVAGSDCATHRFPVDANGTAHPEYARRFSLSGDEEPTAWLAAFQLSEQEGKVARVLDGENEIAQIEAPSAIPDELLRSS